MILRSSKYAVAPISGRFVYVSRTSPEKERGSELINARCSSLDLIGRRRESAHSSRVIVLHAARATTAKMFRRRNA